MLGSGLLKNLSPNIEAEVAEVLVYAFQDNLPEFEEALFQTVESVGRGSGDCVRLGPEVRGKHPLDV